MSSLESADAAPVRARERASLVPEELCLDEILVHRAAVQYDERAVGAIRELMDRACGDLFARPGFSDDERCQRDARHFFEEIERRAHRRGRSVELAEVLRLCLPDRNPRVRRFEEQHRISDDEARTRLERRFEDADAFEVRPVRRAEIPNGVAVFARDDLTVMPADGVVAQAQIVRLRGAHAHPPSENVARAALIRTALHGQFRSGGERAALGRPRESSRSGAAAASSARPGERDEERAREGSLYFRTDRRAPPIERGSVRLRGPSRGTARDAAPSLVTEPLTHGDQGRISGRLEPDLHFRVMTFEGVHVTGGERHARPRLVQEPEGRRCGGSTMFGYRLLELTTGAKKISEARESDGGAESEPAASRARTAELPAHPVDRFSRHELRTYVIALRVEHVREKPNCGHLSRERRHFAPRGDRLE